MKPIKCIFTTGIFVALMFSVQNVAPAQADDLAISGSSLLFPLEQVWSRAYMKRHAVKWTGLSRQFLGLF